MKTLVTKIKGQWKNQLSVLLTMMVMSTQVMAAPQMANWLTSGTIADVITWGLWFVVVYEFFKKIVFDFKLSGMGEKIFELAVLILVAAKWKELAKFIISALG